MIASEDDFDVGKPKCPRCGNFTLELLDTRSICQFCFTELEVLNKETYPSTDDGEINVPTSNETP